MKHLFNKKFTAQLGTKTKDEYGTWTISWVNVSGLVDFPCRINWLKGASRGESVVNGKVEWIRDARVYCAYSTGLIVDLRMVYNSKNYNIVDVADFDEIKKYLTVNIKRSS